MKQKQFESHLDEDLGWRKKEISNLILLAKTNPEEAILKALILLIYAHWEGYIKQASKLYLRYVSELNIKLNQLTANFKAVALKELIQQCFDTKDNLTLSNEINLLNRMNKTPDITFKVPLKFRGKTSSGEADLIIDAENTIINTHSNLKPAVFKNILSIIGIHYKSSIQARESYINRHLLANRNLISHGSRYVKNADSDFNLEIKDIEKLRDVVFSIIDVFREELIEYSRNEYYLTSNETKAMTYLQQKEEELEATFKSIDSKYV